MHMLTCARTCVHETPGEVLFSAVVLLPWTKPGDARSQGMEHAGVRACDRGLGNTSWWEEPHLTCGNLFYHLLAVAFNNYPNHSHLPFPTSVRWGMYRYIS